MLKHVAQHKNTRIVFGDKQAAQNHIAKFPEYSYSDYGQDFYLGNKIAPQLTDGVLLLSLS
jgi:hypothetical protein